MRIAYMIQAHDGFNQLCILIDSLDNECNEIFIHIDKKNEALFINIKEKYKKNKNIHIIEERISVNWGGFSQIEATLALMKSVYNSNLEYDYVSLISGQDMPIKSNEYIDEFLKLNYGKNFIEYDSIGKYKWRLKVYNIFSENKLNRKKYIKLIDVFIRKLQMNVFKINRNNLINFDLYIGSQWFTITYECMKYIIEYVAKENRKYLLDYKYTACPDEHFFQNILLNSIYKTSVINDNLRLIDWSEGKNSPKTLTIEDKEKILESKALWARKFDLNIDNNIISYIGEELL